MGIFERNGKRYKVYERMFMEAQYSFSNLKIYYGHVLELLKRSSEDDLDFIQRLEIAEKEKRRKFDKEHWGKQHTIYSEIYPGYFHNSFLVSTCALFEYHIKKICELVKEEHKVPLEWDEMDGSVAIKTKRFLGFAGVTLIEDPPDQQIFSLSLSGAKKMTVKELWQELINYFLVRNCIAHHNGLIQKMRNPDRLLNYATAQNIIKNTGEKPELFLTRDFNISVCATMMEFFSKLTSAYYGTPLPD